MKALAGKRITRISSSGRSTPGHPAAIRRAIATVGFDSGAVWIFILLVI